MPVVGKEKVTWMKLTTKPLDKEKNYSKVKKALCSLPQIHDQIFDEKSKETVTIKVVCCSPEKVADKLCTKGGGAIIRIEYGIDNPMAPKGKAPEKPKEGDKAKEGEKPKEGDKAKEAEKPKPAAPAPPAPAPGASSSQTMMYNSGQGYPMYDGCYNGYYQQNQQYGYYPQGAQPYPSRPVHDSYGGGGWYGEESRTGCIIM